MNCEDSITDAIVITGKEMEYLHVCRRKLWLFHHGIRPELENQQVQIGMLIGETSFRRERKELVLGDIGVVDWAELHLGVIHEIKKSPAPMEADAAQVRYYMWWMRKHGIAVRRCIIHYPKQRRSRAVEWCESFEEAVEADLAAARRIIRLPAPPPFKQLPWCRSCAFSEYCMS